MSINTGFSEEMLKQFGSGNSEERAVEVKRPRYYYLIVCEGTRTELNYFKAFKKELLRGIVEIDVFGKGMNTRSLVKKAEEIKNNKKHGPPYDKVWVVFDKDSFSASDFDNAIHSAEAKEFGCAWSNEAFEIWYVLHFEYRNSGMPRKDYEKILTKYLKMKYKKNAVDMYSKLEGKQATAIKNAKKLINEQRGKTPSNSNPATKVHLLVQELNEYKK